MSDGPDDLAGPATATTTDSAAEREPEGWGMFGPPIGG